MDIASLGISIDTSDVAKASDGLDKIVESGAKAEKAAEGIAQGFGKASAAANELATSEGKLAESTEEAKARLTAMAQASLDASEYHKSLTTSVNTSGSAMDGARKATTDWAAVQAQANARGQAILETEARLAEETKKAAAATGVQAEGLQALLGKINPALAALQKLDDQQEQLTKYKNAGLIEADTFKEYSARIDAARTKVTGFADDLKKAGVSTAQTQAALRQLPAQFTDIFTSLAGGQNPLTVLLQQGGQIKDSFGGLENTFDALKSKLKGLFGGAAGAGDLGASLAGVASSAKDVSETASEAGESLSGLAENTNTAAEAAENAHKAIGSLPPSVIGASGAYLGMAAAVLGAAAALGTLIYGYSQGAKETDAYNNALILTGNYAGTSAEQLADLAKQVAAVNGTTGDAAASLAKLASTGTVAGGSFQEIATAAANMEDATGRAVEETIAEFVKIGKDPVAAAKELNAEYNFLTASTYAQIVALKEQGDTIGAAKLLTTAYADTINTRSAEVVQNLGYWERSWKAVGDEAQKSLDAIKNIGREQSSADKMVELTQKISAAQSALNADPDDLANKNKLANAKLELDFLTQQKSTQDAIARARGLDAENQKAGIAAAERLKQLSDSNLTNAEKRDKLTKAYLRDVETLRKVNPDDPTVQPEHVAKTLQNIKDKNKDPVAKAAGAVDLTDVTDTKNALAAILADYQNTQKQLDAAQKAGLISQAEYALKREALISNEREEVTAAYEAEIAALEAARAKSTTSAAQRIQLDQKIADARAEMVKAQKDADSQLEVLATNERGRLAKQELSINTYVQALGQQQKALELAGQRAVLGVGRGDQQTALDNQLNAQQDRFAQQALELANQKSDPSRNMSEEEFSRKSQALADANKKATDQIKQNYADVQTAQGDWTNGATAAWENYLDSARNIAGQTKTLFGNAFSSMEDAIVSFATTGKLSFSDFAKSIIADMARIATRQAATGLLSLGVSAVSSYFAGGSTATTAGSSASDYTGTAFSSYVAGARASGGPVDPNSLYQVNELGPELYSEGGKSYLMTGANGGSVTPLGTGAAMSSASSSGGGVSINAPVTVVTQDRSSEGMTLDQAALAQNLQTQMKAAAEKAVAESWRPGGTSYKNANGRA